MRGTARTTLSTVAIQRSSRKKVKSEHLDLEAVHNSFAPDMAEKLNHVPSILRNGRENIFLGIVIANLYN